MCDHVFIFFHNIVSIGNQNIYVPHFHTVFALQVHNHLTHGIEVYYKLGDDCKGRCGEMTPDGTLNVPLEAVYAAPYELYFKVMHSE